MSYNENVSKIKEKLAGVLKVPKANIVELTKDGLPLHGRKLLRNESIINGTVLKATIKATTTSL